MGICQAERHSTLTATFTGSNPVCPVYGLLAQLVRACYKYMSQVRVLYDPLNRCSIDIEKRSIKYNIRAYAMSNVLYALIFVPIFKKGRD